MIDHCRLWCDRPKYLFLSRRGLHVDYRRYALTYLSPRTYCLFCRAGQENRIMKILTGKGYFPLSPLVVHWKPGDCGVKKTAARLLPGYIFFDADAEPIWSELLSDNGIIRVLQYADGDYALRGDDTVFIDWLKEFDGIIDVSQVVQIGTKIEFVSGPLRNFVGYVVKVNKNRKRVKVAFGNDGSLLHEIWCSIEYINVNADTDRMQTAF